MRIRTPIRSTLLALCFIGSLPSVALGKRAAPVEVPPVLAGGVRYEAPHVLNPCKQNGGCVVAYDNATNALLWSVKVYCTRYDSNLEQDVQDVFITSLALEGGRLLVGNEKGQHFSIATDTQTVSGDDRGCSNGSSGCRYLPGKRPQPTGGILTIWGALGLLGIVRARRKRGRS